MHQDLTGMVFGKLSVIKETDMRGADGSVMWQCKCSCGNITNVTTTNLKSGNTKSCGCYRVYLPTERKKENQFEFRDGYYVGFATNTGEEFTFDICDFDLVSKYAWRIDKYGYVVTDINKRRAVRLHRLILGDDIKVIDHKNGNTKDNRRMNIRAADCSKNQMNRKVGSNSLTGLRGVTYRKDRDIYFARIKVNGKNHYLGAFKTAEEAYKARLDAENSMFGEFSYENSRGGDKS